MLSAGDPGWATGAEAGAGGGVPGALRRGCSGGIARMNVGMDFPGGLFTGVTWQGGWICVRH